MNGSSDALPAGRFTILLAKEDFKFSCAHFTLFGDDQAELLHGHNYRVRLELAGPELDELGILVDFDRVKRTLRAYCAELDSRVLIPRDSALLEIAHQDDQVDVRFDAREYRFPAADVFLLPLANTTVELLAAWLWRRLAADFVDLDGIDELQVEVGETAGQGAAFRALLGDRGESQP